MFDRRVEDWITVNAYLFNAQFDDGLTAEIQVNPEFGSTSAAQAEANKYGEPSAIADRSSNQCRNGLDP